MSETSKSQEQNKGDEVLRRLLKTPPKPHEPPNKRGLKPEGAASRKTSKKTDSQQ